MRLLGVDLTHVYQVYNASFLTHRETANKAASGGGVYSAAPPGLMVQRKLVYTRSVTSLHPHKRAAVTGRQFSLRYYLDAVNQHL